jgi:hypothetical protein
LIGKTLGQYEQIWKNFPSCSDAEKYIPQGSVLQKVSPTIRLKAAEAAEGTAVEFIPGEEQLKTASC